MKPTGLRVLIFAIAATISLASPAMADLGAAKAFAILSSGGGLTLKNRDTVTPIPILGAVTCPGATGCPVHVGSGTTISTGGNGAASDQINADAIAGATAPQGINCPSGVHGAAICLGNNSQVTGKCITGGGAVSNPAECAGGPDISGTNSEVTTLLTKAGPDAAAFSAFLAALHATQILNAINLKTGGSLTLTASNGLNVINLPSITTGAKATITINNGGATTFVVINIGTSGAPGVLALGDGASIVLSGGLNPGRVVFNVEGGGGPVQLGNDTTFNGTILAPQQGIAIGNGGTSQPLTINGALLAGKDVSIGNNMNVNFYPLAQIARPGTVRLIGTVDVGTLPPPVGAPPPAVASDQPEPGPNVEGVPGQPGLSATPFPLVPFRTTTLPDAPVLTLPDPPLGVGLQILGLNDKDNLGLRVPPDTQMAVGQATVVELVNRTGAVYDSSLHSFRFKRFDLWKAFFFSETTGTDPRVLYDAPSQTFFMAFEQGPTTSGDSDFIRLAVASDPIPQPNGSIQWPWKIYDVTGNFDGICNDQPKLGVSDTMVTLSWNDYDTCVVPNTAAKYLASESVVIQKQGLLNRDNTVPGTFFENSGMFQIVPVQSLSSSGGVQYAAYHNTSCPKGTDSNNLHVLLYIGTPGQDDMTFFDIGSFDISPISCPPDAKQPPGGNGALPTQDDRLLSAVWKDDHLWTVLNEDCAPVGDVTLHRACIRLLEVSTLGDGVLVNRDVQERGGYIYYPAVTLAGNGDLFFGFTESSASLNPRARVVGVPGGTDFGSFGQAALATPDGSSVYSTPALPNRWGDYSAAAPDPNDPTGAWVAQEYSSGDWSTIIANVFISPP